MTSLTLTGTSQSFVLTYDDNGNLAQKSESTSPSNVTTYTWDSRNRLTAITGPDLAATFEYDVLDRRITRTVSGQTTRYLYDGLQALGEIVNGEQIGLLTGLSLDEAIARYTSQGARVHLTDALNTVLAQARADRSIQNYYAYSPYGESSALGPDEGNSVQYTARENDRTGLYYYRARYYDPLLKRFIAEDPIGLRGGVNVYSYVAGRPISMKDPRGLDNPGMGPYGPYYNFVPSWNQPFTFSQVLAQRWSELPSNEENWCTWAPDLFPKACRSHDDCYSTAGRCKASCDLDFYMNIMGEANAVEAAYVAPVYYLGVRMFGGDFYQDAQRYGTWP
jgi:RHS repeat-associated protein